MPLGASGWAAVSQAALGVVVLVGICSCSHARSERGAVSDSSRRDPVAAPLVRPNYYLGGISTNGRVNGASGGVSVDVTTEKEAARLRALYPGIRVTVRPGFEAVPSRPGPRSQVIAATLMPGGTPLGAQGPRPWIRVVAGGAREAQRMFDVLASGGRDITTPGHPGKVVELPDGGFVGLRPEARPSPPTIDVFIPGVPFERIRFVGTP